MAQMHNIGYSMIALLLMTGQAHAWGDENWSKQQPVTINVEVEPNYLQQRIETRQRRFDIQHAEQNRRQHVTRVNDRKSWDKK